MSQPTVPVMVDYLLDEAIEALESDHNRPLALTHCADAVLKSLCPPGEPVPIELAKKIRTIIQLGGAIDRRPAA